MKENTIKELDRVFNDEWGTRTGSDDSDIIVVQYEAIKSLARRVRKLERAAKSQETARVTTERKVKQEQYPRRDDDYMGNFSVDVLIKCRFLDKEFEVVGYYAYATKEWKMRIHGSINLPIISWRYIPGQAEIPAQSQPANQWISVSEQLPEREDESDVSISVLAIRDNGEQSVGYYDYRLRNWTKADSPFNSWGDLRGVTHWQPLPEPPHD